VERELISDCRASEI